MLLNCGGDGLVAQSYVTLATPWTATRLLCPWNPWGKNTGVGCHFLLCLWTVLLEKTLKSPLDSKEIKPVNPKGNQSWLFIGRTDAEAEAPVLWPSDAKSQLIGQKLVAMKNWWQEEKGDNRRWDGWMTSLTQWRWAWANSGSWLRTGKPGVLQFTGWQRVGHDLVTEQNHKTDFYYAIITI